MNLTCRKPLFVKIDDGLAMDRRLHGIENLIMKEFKYIGKWMKQQKNTNNNDKKVETPKNKFLDARTLSP